jgi:hypothetical protein
MIVRPFDLAGCCVAHAAEGSECDSGQPNRSMISDAEARRVGGLGITEGAGRPPRTCDSG